MRGGEDLPLGLGGHRSLRELFHFQLPERVSGRRANSYLQASGAAPDPRRARDAKRLRQETATKRARPNCGLHTRAPTPNPTPRLHAAAAADPPATIHHGRRRGRAAAGSAGRDERERRVDAAPARGRAGTERRASPSRCVGLGAPRRRGRVNDTSPSKFRRRSGPDRPSRRARRLAAKGCAEGIGLLLQHGADPNLLDKNGRAPLHLVCGGDEEDEDDLDGASRPERRRGALGSLGEDGAGSLAPQKSAETVLVSPSSADRCPRHLRRP